MVAEMPSTIEAEFALGNPAVDPSLIKALESLAMKTAPGFVQKFEVGRHWHDVFVLFPLPPNLEVTEDFAGYIGFEGLLVKQTKRFQVAEEPLIRREMRDKTPETSRAGIHESEGDHRRGTRDGSR